MFQSLPVVLADMDEKIAVLVAAAIVACVVIFVIHSIRQVRETRETEQTKREIAAYVAEGSITPDDAVKLLQAGAADDAATMSVIADSVAWGTISPAKAERLIRAIREERPRSDEPAAGGTPAVS